MSDMMERLDIRQSRGKLNAATLPFAPADVTAGSEAEMQTVVEGRPSDVDLPLLIDESNYLANIRQRAKTGDAPLKVLTDLDQYLKDNPAQVWENSWVRFPMRTLAPFAQNILRRDLLKDKERPEQGRRGDIGRFMYMQNSEDYLRVPVSYLLKLSLADLLASGTLAEATLQQTGQKCMDYFLNDNTSPETSSFYLIRPTPQASVGSGVATEMALRYLLGQVLIEHANTKFLLRESGQSAAMYYAPHPPVRQKQLSQSVSDSFYRELFMNPCLSGWSRGEDKHEYMHLCHRVLSRSQFNAVLKLREAGIITNNLVSLPNLSNISLANNGTHVSLGSKKMTALMGNAASGFTRHSEKYLGDLVVKIAEHFLPLFVGAYTAAPYRLGFEDFHPEKALGFLPHELSHTHLRMLWRRWKKKAHLSVLGWRITPFGPRGLDRFLGGRFGLKGDFVPDYRLLDYLVAILSTDQSPALCGKVNNSLRLKQDLADLGVFDTKMSLYLFEKMREFDVMGFSGFEARHYSLFDGFQADMASAVNLQNLIYLLAFKYIAQGQIDHCDIPDSPFIESERRQIIFGAAIGLPTFFVRRDTPNALMRRILEKTRRTRNSSRYNGYVRVHHLEYRRALVELLKEDAADLLEMLNLKDTLCDLEARIAEPDRHAASGKLTRGILEACHAGSPMSVRPDTFNAAAETYYRTKLRQKHITESLELLRARLRQTSRLSRHPAVSKALSSILQDHGLESSLTFLERDFLTGTPAPETLEKLAGLIITCVADKNSAIPNTFNNGVEPHEASVC